MIEHIAGYKGLLATDPQPPDTLRGDGVLYAMFEDNDRADLGVLVGLKMLREVGWQGRIQFWHVGHHPAIDAGLDVEIIDAGEVQARVGGECRYPWTLKSFAIRYGGLKRVQWLDWDNMNVVNPTPLFAALDARPMLTWHGDWSDRWGFNKEIHQAVIGGPSPLRPIQGGTYFIDCANPAAWKLLTLQRYCDDHHAWWYPANRNSDEEAWRLGIAATGLLPWQEAGNLPWRSGVAWVNEWQGQPLCVHRCYGKLWSDCIPTWHDDLPREAHVRELYERFRRDGGYNPSGRKCDRPATVTAGAKDDRAQRVQALRHRARQATERKTALDAHAATMRRKTICEGCPAFRLGDVRIERWCSLADERPGQPHDCEHGRFSRWTARLTNLAANKCPADKWPS